MFAIGQCIAFQYPRKNRSDKSLKYGMRRALILSCRDTFDRPLEAATLITNPYVIRGRWLYTCLDLDKREVRHFYDASMVAVQRLRASNYRLTAESWTGPKCRATLPPQTIEKPGGLDVPPTLIARRAEDDASARGGSAMNRALPPRGVAVAGYRLGVFNPDPDRPGVRLIGRIYMSDQDDALLMKETIAEFNDLAAKTPGYRLCISAFPVTAEIHSDVRQVLDSP